MDERRVYSRRRFLEEGMHRAVATVVVPAAVVLFDACGAETKTSSRKTIKQISGKIGTFQVGEDMQITPDSADNPQLKIINLDLDNADSPTQLNIRLTFGTKKMAQNN